MGFPSTGIESAYRNDLDQVRRFFDARHPDGRYRVYNLCAERSYHGSALGGDAYDDCMVHYPFEDHNPPCLEMIHPLMLDCRKWLAAGEDRVVALHCKAGKGRTGVIASALLVHLGEVADEVEALTLFAEKRTNDGKGVTIPSQRRYLGYYCAAARQGEAQMSLSPECRLGAAAPLLRVTRLAIIGCPSFDNFRGGCDPYCVVKAHRLVPRAKFSEPETSNPHVNERTMFSQSRHPMFDTRRLAKVPHAERGATVELDVSGDDVFLKGDVKFAFFDRARGPVGRDTKMFTFWLHTHFLLAEQQASAEGVIRLQRHQLDKACGKKHKDKFPDDFEVQLRVELAAGSAGTTFFDERRDEHTVADDEEFTEDDDEELIGRPPTP